MTNMILPEDLQVTVTVADLIKIRSLANDYIGSMPKPKDMEPTEFTSLCWVMATSAILGLNLKVELPKQWIPLTILK